MKATACEHGQTPDGNEYYEYKIGRRRIVAQINRDGVWHVFYDRPNKAMLTLLATKSKDAALAAIATVSCALRD